MNIDFKLTYELPKELISAFGLNDHSLLSAYLEDGRLVIEPAAAEEDDLSEIDYRDGYDEGLTDGLTDGYHDGYVEGYEHGYRDRDEHRSYCDEIPDSSGCPNPYKKCTDCSYYCPECGLCRYHPDTKEKENGSD